MKKYTYIGFAVGLAFVSGCVLRGFFVRPADAPPPGYDSRVVDAIPGKSIVEYFGAQYGVGMRIRYLRDDSGLHPLKLNNLSWYIAEKYAGTPHSRDRAIRDFIALHNPRETILLSSARDIPGFKVQQLDPDLQQLSLTRIDVPDSRRMKAVEAGILPPSAPSVTLTIVYTWTRVGGELKRYRFRTHEGKVPYGYSCISLQNDLGDAVYLH